MDMAGTIPPVHTCLIPAWRHALTLPGEKAEAFADSDTPLPQAPKGGHLPVGQPAGTPEVAWPSVLDAYRGPADTPLNPAWSKEKI